METSRQTTSNFLFWISHDVFENVFLSFLDASDALNALWAFNTRTDSSIDRVFRNCGLAKKRNIKTADKLNKIQDYMEKTLCIHCRTDRGRIRDSFIGKIRLCKSCHKLDEFVLVSLKQVESWGTDYLMPDTLETIIIKTRNECYFDRTRPHNIFFRYNDLKNITGVIPVKFKNKKLILNSKQ